MAKVQNTKHVFDEIPVLSNDRIILRGVLPEDASNLIGLAVYDGFHASNEAEVLTILEKINLNQKNGDGIQWAIQLKEKDDVIGLCSYHRGYPNNIGEIGYVLKPAYRGKGIMTEVVKLMTTFGLDSMKLNNIVAYTDSSNIASINVLKRAGFHQVQSTHDNQDLKFAKRQDMDAS